MKKILPFLTIFLFSSSFALAQTTTPQQILNQTAADSSQPTSSTTSPNSISITASPPQLELEALPGATLQDTIKITNPSETELVFKADISDFIVTDNQGTPIPVNETVSGRWSLASWINVSPHQIVLKPQESAVIDVFISLPQDALAGGHYAMITYQPSLDSTLAQGTSGSAINQKVGTLVYLQVIGDITEAAYLKQFTAPKFSEYGPVNLHLEIENLGDIHLKPQGTVVITNLFNQTILNQELEAKNIFPFAARTYDYTLEGKWHLGRFKAQLFTTAGDNQIPIEGLIYFWIIPYKEISVILLALIATLVILKLKHRSPKTPAPEQPVTPETPQMSSPA